MDAFSNLPLAPVDFWSWMAFACVALAMALIVHRINHSSFAWKGFAIAGGAGAFGLIVVALTGGVAWSV